MIEFLATLTLAYVLVYFIVAPLLRRYLSVWRSYEAWCGRVYDRWGRRHGSPGAIVKISRIPIIRRLEDGTIDDGTARYIERADGFGLADFRDLDGNEMVLPPGASFEVAVDLEDVDVLIRDEEA